MKWFFTLLFLAGAAAAEQLNINQFGGINTDYSPLTLQQNESPDSQNIVSDLGPGIQPRQGFTECSTHTASASWVFPHSNGTRYRIIHSGNSLLADTGACTFDATVSTVAAAVRTAGTVLGDVFYFGNTTDGLKAWNASAVSIASAALTVSQLATHKGCVWAAGKTSSPRTIFKSAFGDGTNWTLLTDPAVTDPAQFVIGGASDEVLTALYASHRGELVWMKSRSFGAVAGNDRSDFSIRTYSDNVGTAYSDSIQDCDGLLRWLGPSRTVYEWNGSKLENIGKNIKTLLEGVGQGDANARAFTITSQTDWQAGTIGTGLSATVSPGDMFGGRFTHDAFTDGDFTASPVWTVLGVDAPTVSGNAVVFNAASSGGSFDDNHLYTANPITSGVGYWEATVTGFDTAGEAAYIGITTNTPTGGSTIGYYFELTRGASGSTALIGLNLGAGAVTIFSGGISNPTSPFTIGLSRDSSSLFTAYVNGASVGSGTNSSATSGFASLVIGGETASPGTITLDDVKYRILPSTYVSASFSLGNVSSFGVFEQTSDADGGNLHFVLYTDTDSVKTITSGVPVAGTFVSSQAITSGEIPSISTGAFAFFSIGYSTTDVTADMYVNDLTLRWDEGNTLAVPSAWFRQRYWMGVSRNSTTNNLVLVFDRNRQWQKYTGINMAAVVPYAGTIFFGNASGNFQYETGYDDDGTSIAAYYQTPTFSPAGPNLYSLYNDLFMTMDRSGETLTPVFQVDGISTDESLYSVVMNTQSGVQNVRIPFPWDSLHQGKNISFKFSVTGSSFWRLLGATLDFAPERVAF